MAEQTYTQDDVSRLLSYRQYIRDRYRFGTEQCWTKDEIDPDAPIRLMPPLPHLRYAIKRWEEERLLGFLKSRRMQMTWLMCCLDLHVAMYTPHSAVYIVSGDLAKSEKLVGRCKFLYDHLDEEKVLKPPMSVRLGVKGEPTILRFGSGGFIEALPGEPEKIRQEAATLMHVEEIQSWETDKPERAWKAMLPALQGAQTGKGGKIVFVFTAMAGSFSQRLSNDELGMAVGG